MMSKHIQNICRDRRLLHSSLQIENAFMLISEMALSAAACCEKQKDTPFKTSRKHLQNRVNLQTSQCRLNSRTLVLLQPYHKYTILILGDGVSNNPSRKKCAEPCAQGPGQAAARASGGSLGAGGNPAPEAASTTPQ